MLISVIICTHSPREECLQRTLDALRRQTLAKECWELIVIDNASSPKLEGRLDLSWHPNASVLREGQIGLSYARERGVRSARGNWLIFCDDDNFLGPTYCEAALKIAVQKPDLALLGGRGLAVFEGDEPEWFDSVKGAFAVGEPYREEMEVTREHSKLWGAGLVVRRLAILSLYENGFRHLLSDRTGDQIVSGGDHELFLALRIQGWRMWYSSRLVFEHYMPQSRCRWAWYTEFQKGCARYSCRFDPYEKFLYQMESGESVSIVKSGVIYQIYLSIRQLILCRNFVTLLFRPLRPGSDSTHKQVCFQKWRLIGLICEFWSYRANFRSCCTGSWIHISPHFANLEETKH